MMDLSRLQTNWEKPTSTIQGTAQGIVRQANPQDSGWGGMRGPTGGYGGGSFPGFRTTQGGTGTTGGGTDWANWFQTTPGSYKKWQQGSDPQYDPNDPAVGQDWWRNPQVGGGVVWNPQYGWQDRSQVKGLYKAGTPFDQFGLTPQTEKGWKDYFPNAVTDAGGGGGGTGGFTQGTGGGMGTNNQAWDDYWKNWNMPQPDIGESTGVQYPSQWGQASDIYSGFGAGDRTPDPSQWGQATDWLTGMFNQGGMPTDTTAAYRAAQEAGRYDTEDAIKQAAEQAGMGGTRYSSMMGRSAQDIAGRNAANLASGYAQNTMAAQEAARGRQMSGIPMLQGLGAGTAGLSESARDRAMQGATGLANMGSLYSGYDTNLMNQASGLGGNLFGQNNQAAQSLFGNWNRTTAENNPWLSAAMQLATGQGMPQQYKQGLGSQLLSGMGGLGTLAAGLCGGGG